MSLSSRSKDDALVNSLVDLARDEDTDVPVVDERLEALCHGRLSPEQRRDLEAKAASDPALARALEMFAPVSDGELDRLTGAVAATLGKQPQRAPVVDDLARRRKARRTVMTFVGLATTAAAGVSLFVLLEGRSELPSYALQVTGGDQTVRGGDQAPPVAGTPGPAVRLWSDAQLEIVLRPGTQVARAVRAAAFLRQGARVEPVNAALDVAPTGAVRLAGRAADLFGSARGDVVLVLVVRASDLDTDERSLATAAASQGRGWQRIELPLALLDARQPR